MAIAALFSGQGSQYPGMGKELRENFPRVRAVYECASDILGFDVAEISESGDEETLARTNISQPVIFTLSAAAWTASLDIFEEPDAVAGHSLGEFAALYAAGAYSLEDGLHIIKARSTAMHNAASTAKGAMYAITGSSPEAIKTACVQSGGFVEPVNFNLPTQTVISGEEAAAAEAAGVLSGQGARAVRLGVSSAFHTKMMDGAAKEFSTEIAVIPFYPVKAAFYSNLTGGKLVIDDYPAYFAKHMVSPVLFTDEINAMAADGIGACVEFGPKKTAVTLAKKNIRSLSVYNVEDKTTLDGLGAFLKGVRA